MQVSARNSLNLGPWEKYDEFGNVRTTRIFGGWDMDTSPQAFIVELGEPGATIRPHFHSTRQFQLILAGSGRLGKKELSRLTFHYADAETPYGPIVAGESGLTFLTLRADANVGAHYMPGSRDKMSGKAGRNLAARFDPTGFETPPNSTMVTEQLWEPSPDGLGASGLHFGPGAKGCLPDPAGTAGEFCLVAEGTLVCDGVELDQDSLIWVDATDVAPSVEAGASGAHVLVMRFPRSSAAQVLTPSESMTAS